MSFKILFFKERDGSVPLLAWLDNIPFKAKDKVMARLVQLKEMGHMLHRPHADYLRDDIYELRLSHKGVQYRVLYFFHGRQLIVVSHGIVKKQVIPEKEIERASARKSEYLKNPEKFSTGGLI